MDLSLKLAIKTIELNLGWIIHLGNCEGCDGSEAKLVIRLHGLWIYRGKGTITLVTSLLLTGCWGGWINNHPLQSFVNICVRKGLFQLNIWNIKALKLWYFASCSFSGLQIFLLNDWNCFSFGFVINNRMSCLEFLWFRVCWYYPSISLHQVCCNIG